MTTWARAYEMSWMQQSSNIPETEQLILLFLIRRVSNEENCYKLLAKSIFSRRSERWLHFDCDGERVFIKGEAQYFIELVRQKNSVSKEKREQKQRLLQRVLKLQCTTFDECKVCVISGFDWKRIMFWGLFDREKDTALKKPAFLSTKWFEQASNLPLCMFDRSSRHFTY